jgi:hypothetical protein
VLKGLSPDDAVGQRLKAKPDLANPRYIPPDPKAIPAAMRVVESAKELIPASTCPDTWRSRLR